MMQQHQQQLRMKQQQNGVGQQGQYQNPSVIKQFPDQNREDSKSINIIDGATENQELDRELQALLSQKELTTSLAEDLLKQFGSSDELDNKTETNNTPSSQGMKNHILPEFTFVKNKEKIRNIFCCFIVLEVKATPQFQPKTEQVVRYQDSSSSDISYSVSLTAEEVLSIAQ